MSVYMVAPGEAVTIVGIFNETPDNTPNCCEATEAPSLAGCCAVGPMPGEPVEHEYFVEATLHTVVRATDGYNAMLDVKEALLELIEKGYAKNDPAHSAIIDRVQQLPESV